MAGFIVLHRKIENWEWYQDANTFRVFIHLLLEANYEDRRWRGIVIKRGQHVTSYEKLASELKLSVQNIRTAIKHLKSTGEVTIKATSKYTLITVANYNKYQDKENDTNNQPNNQPNKQPTNNQQATNKQLTTNNNENNENNENKDIYCHEIRQVVDHLNAVTGKRRSAESKATSNHIRARLKEGATVTDMIAIIDSKAGDWLKDERMKKFIRPETLFSTTHFEDYLEEAKANGKRHDPADWDESNGELI